MNLVESNLDTEHGKEEKRQGGTNFAHAVADGGWEEEKGASWT